MFRARRQVYGRTGAQVYGRTGEVHDDMRHTSCARRRMYWAYVLGAGRCVACMPVRHAYIIIQVDICRKYEYKY